MSAFAANSSSSFVQGIGGIPRPGEANGQGAGVHGLHGPAVARPYNDAQSVGNDLGAMFMRQNQASDHIVLGGRPEQAGPNMGMEVDPHVAVLSQASQPEQIRASPPDQDAPNSQS